MTTVNLSYQNADRYGRAAFDVLDTYVQSNLLAGSEPPLRPADRFLLGDSLNLAQFTVVGLSGGKLVKATYNADPAQAVKPIGILAHAVQSGASNTTVYAHVWWSGCFAVEGPLVWDATFDTDQKKIDAFKGSPTPTQIVVRYRTTPAS